jgi:ketosteroid isomerase-like protein
MRSFIALPRGSPGTRISTAVTPGFANGGGSIRSPGTNKEPWDYFKSHIERTLEAGDIVVTVVRFEAVGKHSGAKVELPFVNVFELEGGLIVKFTPYDSLEAALDAAGLRA